MPFDTKYFITFTSALEQAAPSRLTATHHPSSSTPSSSFISFQWLSLSWRCVIYLRVSPVPIFNILFFIFIFYSARRLTSWSWHCKCMRWRTDVEDDENIGQCGQWVVRCTHTIRKEIESREKNPTVDFSLLCGSSNFLFIALANATRLRLNGGQMAKGNKSDTRLPPHTMGDFRNCRNDERRPAVDRARRNKKKGEIPYRICVFCRLVCHHWPMNRDGTEWMILINKSVINQSPCATPLQIRREYIFTTRKQESIS